MLWFPLVLPIGIKYFDYTNSNFFKLKKKRVLTQIFKCKKQNYIGSKIFFSLVINLHIMLN